MTPSDSAGPSAHSDRHPARDARVPGPHESPQLFDHPVLDAFSRVPFWVVPLIYVPGVALLIGWAHAVGTSPAGIVGQFAAGWFVWTLMEYWLHRTLFHWVPDAPWGERFHFLVHGVHHTWYQDRLRLVMPPAASLAIGVVVLATLRALASALSPWLAPTWVPGLFAGIVFGYLVYDMIHYHVHHARPTNRVMLALRAHHAKHHHNPRFQNKKFGVSFTLWDHVFGTYQ